jgi:fatty acid desaturase
MGADKMSKGTWILLGFGAVAWLFMVFGWIWFSVELALWISLVIVVVGFVVGTVVDATKGNNKVE